MNTQKKAGNKFNSCKNLQITFTKIKTVPNDRDGKILKTETSFLFILL